MQVSLRRIVPVLLLAVVVMGVFVIGRDVARTREALESFHGSAFALACALAFTNYLLRFLKWEFYLARLEIRGIPKLESLLVFLSGFVLTVTPGKVGEVFKSVVLAERHGVPVERTGPIVLAERLTDVVGIVILIALGTIGFSGGAPWALVGTLLVAVGLALVSSERAMNVAFEFIAKTRFASLVPKLRDAYRSLRILVAPSALVVPSVISVAAWSLECVALFVIVRGFDVEASLALCTFFYATSTLVGAVVPVPGGLGITEGLLQEQMVRLGGIAAGPATAAMILVRLATLWFAVVVGFVAYGALGLLRPSARVVIKPASP
jgi:uncharacterized protein (TIRG00374 family)